MRNMMIGYVCLAKNTPRITTKKLLTSLTSRQKEQQVDGISWCSYIFCVKSIVHDYKNTKVCRKGIYSFYVL